MSSSKDLYKGIFLHAIIVRETIIVKGTLMQIWKSPYMFVLIQKKYPENLALLVLRILELYTRKVCKLFVYKYTETIEYVKN